MILLTKFNAKERCRTCLQKLLKSEVSLGEENNFISFQNKFADINSNKNLQDMLERYLSIQFQVDFYRDQLYPQYVCMECLKQLQTFETFRNKAIDCAKKLYMIFNGNCNVDNIELNEDGLECKVDSEEHSSGCAKDIFNLFLKDSLMETEEIILDNGDPNNIVNNMDPDPFQNTQNNIRKPRDRKFKSKSARIENSKLTLRKSKKSSSYIEKRSIKIKFGKKLNKNETNQTENEDVDDWQNRTFPYIDDSSSDNEVLSKKIIHSDRIFKGTKETQIKDNFTLSKDRYIAKSIDSRTGLKEKIVKDEHGTDDVTNESESRSNAVDTFPDAVKVEKKKRHYILNSGRKKGLANKYKCDQCQHKFGHKLTLEAHVRKVHEGQKKAFKCHLCDKAYSFIGGLSTHIKDVHERKQDSYDCTVVGCDKKYSNFITLQRHVRFKHLNVETPHQYVCEQCGATFKQSSNLRYHMKTRHPTEEDLKRKELLPKDRLECEECNKSFHSQYTLKYHKLRVHADEKKFECKICGRRVAKQFMLDSHMLVHSDQKMACEFCGREFVRKYQVEAHIRAVHQKLKPFQCPHCSESFASRKTLRHHIYIHTGEKPYVCDICGQAYRQPTCLKNHRKIHNKLSATNPTAASADEHAVIK